MRILNTLSPAEGAKKAAKRVGRGQGCGSGCTAGRGNKGAKSRSGERKKLYFEGGQTPLTRRVPKKGFNNSNFRIVYQIVNVGDLEKAGTADKEIDAAWLFENGFVHSKDKPVKVLGSGELSKKILIKADAFSKNAREKIEKAKGKAEVVGGV